MKAVVFAAAMNLLSVFSDGDVGLQRVPDEKSCRDAICVFNEGRTCADNLAYHLSVAAWRAKHPCAIGKQRYLREGGSDPYWQMKCSLPDNHTRYFYRWSLKAPWDNSLFAVSGYINTCFGISCENPRHVTRMFCAVP